MTGTAIAAPQGRGRFRWLNAKVIIPAIVIVAAAGYLIYSNMQTGVASYFVTVGELTAQSAVVDGERVRVGGNVEPSSIVTGGVGEPLRFSVTDGTTTIPVVYDGVTPDIFSDNVQVVVEGTYHAGGTFQADTLLTKCPSKFESAETGAQQ